MVKKKTKFVCQECGYHSPKYMGKCPGCGSWNTMVEELEAPTTSRRLTFNTGLDTGAAKPHLLTDVETKLESRIETHFQEFNRVLGGGIVHGSLVLIGGDPGIGKSTLLL
ncbi:DNA repair protein RadA, partial [Microbacteriaceae bacterium 4G12]